MSTPRTDLLSLLADLPGLNETLERKALIDFVGYPHIGIYLDWSGAQVHFAEALIDELSRRGQEFTLTFLTSMTRAPQVGVDKQEALAEIHSRIAALSAAAWLEAFPAEPLTEQDRTALAADLDMLAATVVSTVLLPYYKLGADEMTAAAGERATAAATRIEATLHADPIAGPSLTMFQQNPQQSEAAFLAALRAVLGQDDALAQSLAADLTHEPEQADAALQAMVTVSQNIRTVQGDVVGAIVGAEVLERIGVVQDIDTVESGGVVAGAIIGNPGSSLQIGGQRFGGSNYESGSAHHEENVHVEGSGAAATGGGVAAGAGGVAVGGDVAGGDIVAGNDNRIDKRQVETGGGAYVGGSVTAGGNFVGRDALNGVSGERVNVSRLVIYQGESHLDDQSAALNLRRYQPRRRDRGADQVGCRGATRRRAA